MNTKATQRAAGEGAGPGGFTTSTEDADGVAFSPARVDDGVSAAPVRPNGLLTMMETCREVGMTYQTLKFYCNKGLVPNVKRDRNNRRVFDAHDVEWIKGLTCLKRCGMSIEEMGRYLELCLEGPVSIPARKEMLAEKREVLVERLGQIRSSIEYIDQKQEFYDDVMAGRVEYRSNLIRKDRE